jgi:hypothetical protein
VPAWLLSGTYRMTLNCNKGSLKRGNKSLIRSKNSLLFFTGICGLTGCNFYDFSDRTAKLARENFRNSLFLAPERGDPFAPDCVHSHRLTHLYRSIFWYFRRRNSSAIPAACRHAFRQFTRPVASLVDVHGSSLVLSLRGLFQAVRLASFSRLSRALRRLDTEDCPLEQPIVRQVFA